MLKCEDLRHKRTLAPKWGFIKYTAIHEGNIADCNTLSAMIDKLSTHTCSLFRASLPFNQIIYLTQASACDFKKVSIKYKQIFKFNDCSEGQQHKRTLALKSFRFSFVTGSILTTK